MQFAKLWQKLLGVERTVVEKVIFDEDEGAIVASVRPRKGATRRCGICSRRCAWEDRGEGRRRWRTLDLGSIRAYLEADAPRVRCPEHGVVVVSFPWARHRARHSLMFEDQVAWLAKHASRSAVEELMRIAWRTVGAIVTRVVADAHSRKDPLDGLRRIGIDEISYKKGFKYLIVIVDHDSGRLIWAAPGRDKKTLNKFFDALGKSRSAMLKEVSADGADWIAEVVHSRCLNAKMNINGGLYTQTVSLPPLSDAFRSGLIAAGEFDWALISPAIFGSMFQTVKSKEARRAGGEHYTTEENILKTVGPLFLDELRDRLDRAWDDKRLLTEFHNHLGRLRFLDPACGCGNFLIIAYRELRALELDLLKRRRDLGG